MTDAYEIPTGVFPHHSPRLPDNIGKVVMLAAVLETKIESLASGVDNRYQEVHGGGGLAGSAPTIRRRLRLYNQNPYEISFANRTEPFLVASKRVLDERNFIVHGVWAKTTDAGWWAWKPRRYRKGVNGGNWIEGKELAESDFVRICDELIDLIREAQELFSIAGSIPRRKD